MSLDEILESSRIEFPQHISLEQSTKLLKYLAQKIPAELQVTVIYEQKINSQNGEEAKSHSLSISGWLKYENKQIWISTIEKNMEITHISFLPEISKKEKRENQSIKNKIKQYVQQYFDNYIA